MLTGHTRTAGVIGSPIRHSLSPAIFNAAFAAAGLDWAYLAFDVPDGAAGHAMAAVSMTVSTNPSSASRVVGHGSFRAVSAPVRYPR